MAHDQSEAFEALDLYVIDLENLHHIQRGILGQLYTVPQAAYSDLKPPELTGNAFNYHLRHTLAQKLIQQTGDNHYTLTSRGRLLLDNVSLPSMKLKLRPVSGVALVLTSAQHGMLLYRSNREPLRGLVGLPFGKLRLGDSLETTLERVIDKRQLDPATVIGLRSLGLANVRYFDHSELVSHRVSSVWAGTYVGPVKDDHTVHGSSFWSRQPENEPSILEEVKISASWPNAQSTVEISAALPR